MNDIGEALGTAAEGALYGRALEPKRGEGADGHTDEGTCLNCGTTLAGPHCHTCGQRAHVHRTIGAFMHDLVHGALHFEGKIWHTLPLLAWKPGELTRRYIEGERARFVSPMALFLFSVFLMFAVFQMVDFGASTESTDTAPVVTTSSDGTGQRLAALRAARAEMGDDNPAAAVLDAQIESLEAPAEGAAEESGTAGAREEGDDRITLTGSEYWGTRVTTVETGWSFLDQGIEKWRDNPSLMAYKLQANSYKFSWLLIPLSIPFVWLLFLWRRRFAAYDHAVFVTYSLAFMTLFFVAVTVLGTAGLNTGGLLELAAVLIPPYHIYRQLKGAYRLSRFSALWRTLVLLVFIFVILLLFLNVLLVLGGMG